MKNKNLLIIVLLLLPIAVVSFLKKETNFNLKKNSKNNISYTINIKLNDGTTEELDLENYVIGVVAGEMPASFELEALKAQAIAARTYALFKKEHTSEQKITITTNDQVYLNDDQMRKKWQDDYNLYYNRVKSAVYDTKNMVLKYQNELIKPYYFSMSNGYTEDATYVFNESKEYLVSVDSLNEDEITDNISKTVVIHKNEFCKKLQISCDKIELSNIKKSASGRVYSLSINNKEFLGTDIRKLLELRSTDFNIVINDEDLYITTKGYGHGVGMSQYGANAMAKRGKKYYEILEHYYKGTKIDNL